MTRRSRRRGGAHSAPRRRGRDSVGPGHATTRSGPDEAVPEGESVETLAEVESGDAILDGEAEGELEGEVDSDAEGESAGPVAEKRQREPLAVADLEGAIAKTGATAPAGQEEPEAVSPLDATASDPTQRDADSPDEPDEPDADERDADERDRRDADSQDEGDVDSPDEGATEDDSDDEPPATPPFTGSLSTEPGRRRRRVKKKARRSWPERILLTAVIVVVLALIGMGVGYGYVKFRFDQVTKVAVKHLKVAAVGQPFNMLVIGSDSRALDSPSDAAHLGVTTAGQRSDVVKIVHVDPATGQIRVLSIPRDTVVTVAGDTSQVGQYNRINSTYDTGPDQLVQTIEADFGIPISHVVQVNFAGFRGAVDAIGGINLNFPVPAKDDYTGLNITQTGCQHLNGGYSLAVARSRHYQYYQDGYWQTDGTSDFGRIQRQNAFLKALITQAESRYNPLTLNAFIGAVVQGVTIDNTFTTAGLIDLAREFHSFSSSSLATATLPTYSDLNSSAFVDLGDVLYVQQPDALQTITQFLGQPPETASTPPPDPDGNPTTVPTTLPATGTTAPGQTTTPASSTTTTTVPNFDPTPC
jgi:LCP family protein required for cell wall assembly